MLILVPTQSSSSLNWTSSVRYGMGIANLRYITRNCPRSTRPQPTSRSRPDCVDGFMGCEEWG